MPKDGGDDTSRVSCSSRTIAIVMPNAQGIRDDPWENYLTTVDAVETLTGYDLFSTLPEPIQRCVEAGINGNNPPLEKGTQSIAFGPAPASATYGDQPFAVTATGGASGNPVTIAGSGACSAQGSNGSASVTILGSGTCTITASQAGNALYDPAPDATLTIPVAKATSTFGAIDSPTIELGTATVTIGGSIGAGAVPTGSVTFSVGGATVSAPIGAERQIRRDDSDRRALDRPAARTRSRSVTPVMRTSGRHRRFDADASSIRRRRRSAVRSTYPPLLRPTKHKILAGLVGYTATDASGGAVVQDSASPATIRPPAIRDASTTTTGSS